MNCLKIFFSFEIINSSDVPIRVLGVNIPQIKDSNVLLGSALKAEELLIIPLEDKDLTSYGAIQAVEGFGASLGDLQVFVSF